MSYKVNQNISNQSIEKEVKELIKIEIERFFDNAMTSSEIDLVFLKSMIYIEELIKHITNKLFGTKNYVGLTQHITQLKLIKGEEKLNNSINLVEKIKNFRDNMAHNLEYHTEDDPVFLKEFNFSKSDHIDDKKYKVAMYFRDVAYGFLYLKIGLNNLDGFISYYND